MIKELTSKESGFYPNQTSYIVEKIRDSFTSHVVFGKLGANLQSICTEAIIFNFRHTPFTYKLETITETDEITKEKTVKETYIFEFDLQVPGTDHKINLLTRLNKHDVERIL
jgi:hypothetical protein